MTTQTDPVDVRVMNHPEPRKYECRAAYRTAVLTAANPFTQIAGYDPLRDKIRFSPATNPYVISGSISQASDVNNLAVPMVNPNGRLIPATELQTQTPVVNAITLAANGVAAYNNNSVGVNATVTGGTVTAIAINGTTTGAISGTFFVPAGGTITVTYSVAPTLTTAAIPVTTPFPLNMTEVITEGQNDVWLTANTYPTVIGFEIIRKVPEK